MIKIIQKGTRRIETCENCGCIFSFEDEDVHKTTSDTDDKYNEECVVCPQCGLVISLVGTKTVDTDININVNITPQVIDPEKNYHFEPTC